MFTLINSSEFIIQKAESQLQNEIFIKDTDLKGNVLDNRRTHTPRKGWGLAMLPLKVTRFRNPIYMTVGYFSSFISRTIKLYL